MKFREEIIAFYMLRHNISKTELCLKFNIKEESLNKLLNNNFDDCFDTIEKLSKNLNISCESFFDNVDNSPENDITIYHICFNIKFNKNKK